MLADEGLTVVVSNAFEIGLISAKPWLRSASPWPVVNASLRFRWVIRRPSRRPGTPAPPAGHSVIASFFPWYWKQSPRKYVADLELLRAQHLDCMGRTPHWACLLRELLVGPRIDGLERSFPFE